MSPCTNWPAPEVTPAHGYLQVHLDIGDPPAVRPGGGVLHLPLGQVQAHHTPCLQGIPLTLAGIELYKYLTHCSTGNEGVHPKT